MGLTGKQMLYKCCGIYCSILACIGIYFFTVMSIFQGMNNRYMLWSLEKINDVNPNNSDRDHFLWGFVITIALNVVCCLGCGYCGFAIKDVEDPYLDDKVANEEHNRLVGKTIGTGGEAAQAEGDM